jgi:hypothetical protein
MKPAMIVKRQPVDHFIHRCPARLTPHAVQSLQDGKAKRLPSHVYPALPESIRQSFATEGASLFLLYGPVAYFKKNNNHCKRKPAFAKDRESTTNPFPGRKRKRKDRFFFPV